MVEAAEPELLAEAVPAAPEAEGDLMSGDDALAWLESLTIGKEDELRAQAELDSEARIAEIMGRRTTPVQEESVEEPAVETVSEPEPETEATVFELQEVEAAEPELLTEAVPAAPEAEGDLMSGDDALAWLESLTIGKEDELRAQAELDSEARIAEIMGRRTTPIQEETVEEPVVETVSEPEPETEATVFELHEVEASEPELLTEAVPAAPEAEGDLMSGDDALAWLESLTIGKEDELRAQAELDSEARIAEIIGRRTTPIQEETVEEPAVETVSEPEPETEATVFELQEVETAEPELLTEAVPAAPEAEGDLMTGDDALAWLESLTIGKEDELRAQAELDSEARIAEIMGRRTTPIQEESVEEPAVETVSEPEPETEATVFELQEVEEAEPELLTEAVPAAPEAEGDLMTGDDALAWLESLTIGKEDELRAQAELDSEARIAEIMGRRTTPVQEETVEEPVVETVSEPEPETETTVFELQEVEITEPELTQETPEISEPKSEPEAVEAEEPVAEVAEPELTPDAPVISEPKSEPEAVKIEEPAVEVAEKVAATAPIAESDTLEDNAQPPQAQTIRPQYSSDL